MVCVALLGSGPFHIGHFTVWHVWDAAPLTTAHASVGNASVLDEVVVDFERIEYR